MELPLSLSTVLAGVRVATVLTIGIATIAAAVGAGGLGEFIFRGLAMVNNQLILAGAIPAALLALARGFPAERSRAAVASRAMSRDEMRASRPPRGVASALRRCAGGRLQRAPARHDRHRLEEFSRAGAARRNSRAAYRSATHLRVERRFYLAGSYICQQALLAGRIDAYVEYTGTALTAILHDPLESDPAACSGTCERNTRGDFELDVLPSLGFNNTFAMVIRGEDARRLDVKTLSEAAPYTPQWRAGFGYEFMERPDGYPGLARVYGLRFAAPPRILDLGPALSRAAR